MDMVVPTIGGALIGLSIGASIAAGSRDGIWPEVWAGLIIAGGGTGFLLSLLAKAIDGWLT